MARSGCHRRFPNLRDGQPTIELALNPWRCLWKSAAPRRVAGLTKATAVGKLQSALAAPLVGRRGFSGTWLSWESAAFARQRSAVRIRSSPPSMTKRPFGVSAETPGGAFSVGGGVLGDERKKQDAGQAQSEDENVAEAERNRCGDHDRQPNEETRHSNDDEIRPPLA